MRACVRACLCLRVFERVCLSASERAGDRACVRTRMRVRASVLVYLGLAFPRSLSGCVPEDVSERGTPCSQAIHWVSPAEVAPPQPEETECTHVCACLMLPNAWISKGCPDLRMSRGGYCHGISSTGVFAAGMPGV